MDTIYRRISWRIMPILILCYIASFIDRTNVGIAQLRMRSDLGFSEQVYGLGITLFFLGLILFEIPSNMMLERVGAGKTLLRIMVIWGVASTSMMFVTSQTGYYALRFLLGAAEAGFFPGVLLYLSFWFPPARRSRMVALFAAAAPISFILGAPLSGLIVEGLDGARGIRGWQWMFLLEGVPTIALGVVAWRFLPARPGDAAWLTLAERRAVEQELQAAAASDRSDCRWAAILGDKRTWALCVAAIGAYTLANAVSFWSPMIIAASGVTSVVHTGLLVAIPPLLGLAAMLLNGWHADRMHERRWHAAGGALVGAAGLAALSLYGHRPTAAVALLSLVTIGHYAGSTVLWSIPSLYYPAPTRARGIAVVTTVGSVGAMLAPAMLGTIRVLTGSLSLGLLISAGAVLMGILILILGVPARALPRAR